MKRVIAGVAVVVVLALGAFVAGGISQNTTNAQVGTGTPSGQSAQQKDSVTYTNLNVPAQPAAKVQISSASNLVTNNLAQQNQAQPAQTVEPTEVAEPTEVGQTPEPTQVAGTPEPTEAAENDGDNVQQGDQNGQDTGASGETQAGEAADAQALASQASITQQQAEQVALAANPGATVVNSSLGDENGTVVYDVELSNGSDVKVNAQTGAIIGTDQAGSDRSGESKNGDIEGNKGP